MSTGRADEFRKEAVRIALTSGFSRRQVADYPRRGAASSIATVAANTVRTASRTSYATTACSRQ